MSGLFGSLSIALRSLLAQQGALETTAHNLANVNTRGFARQRSILREEPPIFFGGVQLGTGVAIDKIESIRDKILELRLHQETQQQGRLEAFLRSLRQVETLFNETAGGGLESALSSFFNSLLQLSTQPNSLPLRQGVLAAAENLTALFRRTSRNVATLATSLDQAVTQAVTEINQLTVEIADLNQQISGLEGVGQEAGGFVDRRDVLIRRLSELIDVALIDADRGSLTITTSNGTALVVGQKSFALGTQLDPASASRHIFAQGVDITATITAGELGGLLDSRDRSLPSVVSDLDNLAASLISAVNTVHPSGFDLSGAAGGDFFVPFVSPGPGLNRGAAANFEVAIDDPALLAASSDGSPGSNENLLTLLAVRDQSIVSGQRPIDFYANLVFRIGNEISNASAELEAEALVLQQLENQRVAISGVSLDEEATNLIRFQRAFEAAARVVSVVDELTQTAINLGRV